MKKIMAFLVALILTFSFSQTQKKQIYLDEKGNIITKNDFAKKYTTKGFDYKIIETDSAKIGKIISLFETGKLTANIAESIRKETENISQKKIDSTDVLVINFFYKEDNDLFNRHCLNFYKKDSSYKKFFRKNANFKQVFVLEKNYNYKERDIFEDANNNIKTLAISENFSCTAYMIIFPDNNYIKEYGEHKYETILDHLKKYLQSKK